jgi:excisionase family DNA binding protein
MTLVGEGRTPELDTLLTVEQAAERLGTSVRFVRRLVFERRIAFVKVGRHVRITTADLDAFIAAGRIDARRREAG